MNRQFNEETKQTIEAIAQRRALEDARAGEGLPEDLKRQYEHLLEDAYDL